MQEPRAYLDGPLDVQQDIQPLIHIQCGHVQAVVKVHQLLSTSCEGCVHVHFAAILQFKLLGLGHVFQCTLQKQTKRQEFGHGLVLPAEPLLATRTFL
jgi:hypothetical protein